VFAGGATEIVLLRHGVAFARRWDFLHENSHRKAHVLFDGLCRRRGFAAGSVLPLKRAMGIREPSFDETGAHDAFLSVGHSLHRE
jgi:hypothetical protein